MSNVINITIFTIFEAQNLGLRHWGREKGVGKRKTRLTTLVLQKRPNLGFFFFFFSNFDESLLFPSLRPNLNNDFLFKIK